MIIAAAAFGAGASATGSSGAGSAHTGGGASVGNGGHGGVGSGGLSAHGSTVSAHAAALSAHRAALISQVAKTPRPDQRVRPDLHRRLRREPVNFQPPPPNTEPCISGLATDNFWAMCNRPVKSRIGVQG
jgi:hypothetical protein